MKKIALILMFVLCLSFLSCGSRQNKIYKTLDNIDVSTKFTGFHVMTSNLSAPHLFTEQYPEEYASVANYGKEGVPHVLNYIEEKDVNSLNTMFFVCCCYEILNIDEWMTEEPLGNIQAHVTALCEYVESGN